MNKTRKAFLLAGSIVSFVEAGVLILVGLIVFGMSSMITVEMVNELLAMDPTMGELTEAQVQAMVQLVKLLYTGIAIYVLALSIATIPVAVKVIKNAENNKKGAIIALLVLSIFTANIITFAFMIVGLCLKNDPVEIVEKQETVTVE
ncbi:MAG TPA: hypothetical protein IAB72_05090 [Candidatus Onthoplasma faecipullorum]|nr:hypothetical protein [Candidatus Onthoplasma faecipullorum]